MFFLPNFFAVRYLWDVRNEDRCCVLTHRAVDICVAWLVYVRTHCVSIATSNQNKSSQLLFLRDAQIITRS